MTIMLPAEQMRWLEAQVAAGRFASIEEALTLAIDSLRNSLLPDDEWVKPLLEEGQKSFDDAGGIELGVVLADLDEFVSKRRTG
jgi:Arc/MetJ-type ribon-helix-helix transcriptional regulator